MRAKLAVLLMLTTVCASGAVAGEIIPWYWKFKKYSIPRVLIGEIIMSDATSRSAAIQKIQAAYNGWDNASIGGILSHTFEDRGNDHFTVGGDGDNTINFLSDNSITYAGKAFAWGLPRAQWRLSDVDIRYNNDSCYGFGVCPYTPQGNEYTYDLDTVLWHEVGHEHGWWHCMSTTRNGGNCSWNTSVMTGHTAPPQCHHMTLGTVDQLRAPEMYSEYPYDASEPGNDTFADELNGTPTNLGVLNVDDGDLLFVHDYSLQGTIDNDCYIFVGNQPDDRFAYDFVVSGYGATYTFMAIQIWHNGHDMGTWSAPDEGGYVEITLPSDSGTYEFRCFNVNGEGMGREYGVLISAAPLVSAVPDRRRPDAPALKILAGKVVVPSLSTEGRLAIFNAGGRLVQSVEVPQGRSMVYTPQGLASGVYFAALNNNTASPSKLVVVR